jgi:hypothetical protein
MLILSHRGYWKTLKEKNSPTAFRRSFDLGFGTETDIRDCRGEIVISHDIPTGAEMTFDAMLDSVAGRNLPIALNIKADGLAASIAERVAAHGLQNWFTFDMSTPEMIVQIRLGLPVFTRCSEYERQPACYERAMGVWVDAFHDIWYSARDLAAFLADGKQVCIVSPELHARDHASLWHLLKSSHIADHPSLMLCTDLPEAAEDYFRSAA